MKKPRILMLTSTYPTDRIVTGTFVRSLAEAVANQGFDVTVLMFSSTGKRHEYTKKGVKVVEYPYSAILPPALHRHNGLIPSVKNSLLAKAEFPLYLASTAGNLSKFSRHADIIHAHWYIPSGLIAAFHKKLSGKKLVVTAWGAEFHLPKSAIVKILLGFVHSNADKKVAVSEYMKKKAGEYGLDEREMIVIPNSIDVEKFSLKRKTGNGIVIATVRRLVPEKRVQDLIEAVSLLDGKTRERVSLWIIGDGPEKKRLMELSRKRGIEGITKFYGMVPNERIPSFLSKTDIYVNPSIQEGMATANLEAMSAGCCVIAADAAGSDEAIIHQKDGLLYEPAKPESLMDCIQFAIRNEKMRKAMSQRASKKVRENYSSDKIAKLYIELYSRMMK